MFTNQYRYNINVNRGSVKIVWIAMALLCTAAVLERLPMTSGRRQEYLLNGYALRWPSTSTEREKSLESGHFIPRNVIQTKMQMWQDRAYVVQPRYKTGVPFTLGTMNLEQVNDEPVIKPYPDYKVHRDVGGSTACKRMYNVIDIYLDRKGLLWVLDNGDKDEGGAVIKNDIGAKVLAVDLSTDDIVTVIDLSSMMADNRSCPQSVAVDYNRNGELYLFVSDVGTHSIAVYNEVQDRFFKTVFPRRMIGDGSSDVLSMMMIRKPKEPNSLYLTYLRSEFIYHTETSAIDEAATSNVLLEAGRKPFVMVFLGTDGGSVIFLRGDFSNNVYAWNTNDEFTKSNFKEAHSSSDCRIPLKVAPGFGDIMWLMETNFVDFVNDTTSCVGPSTKLHPMVHHTNNYERIH